MTKRNLPVPSESVSIAALLHECVVYGYSTHLIYNAPALVVGRRRPFIPCGTDPADVNRECARRYAVFFNRYTETFALEEVDPVSVIPFVDPLTLIAADHARVNAVQVTNGVK